MSRLPSIGGDQDNWGTVLNDFLSVSHNGDGTLKSSAVATTYSQTIAFTSTIPFTYPVTIMNSSVSGAIAFTANTSGAVAGNGAIVRLMADGTNTPTFSGFQKLVNSDAYDNTAGRVHIISFIYNGTDYNYTISQAQVVSLPPTLVSVTATDAHTFIVVLSKSVTATNVGWSFKQNGTTITPSAISGSGTTTLTFTVTQTLLSTDTLLVNYNSGTGNTIDTSSNALASITNLSVTNTVGVIIFTDDFNSSNTANINGRATVSGGKTWTETNTTGGQDIGITSNAAKAVTASGLINDYYIDVGKRNIDVSLVLSTAASSNPGSWIKVALQDANNYIQFNTVNLTTVQYLAGTPTTLFGGSGLSVSGDTIRGLLVGTSMKVYRNGTLVNDATVSSSITGTKIAMFFYQDATTSIDSIQAQ